MWQWSHYTIEDKMRAVTAILDGQTARSLERATGVDHHLLASWVRAYQAGGAAALQPYRHSRRYPSALKAQVVAEYRRDAISLRQLCAKYQISNPGVCAKWIAQSQPRQA